MPYLPAARASIFCVTRATLIFGTHELFIGEVEGIEGDQTTADDPLGWIAGDFARLAPLG